jgi:hypothetical protein
MSPQLTYYDLSPRVTAFSTTRHGGFSTGTYAELNVNAYCGDTQENIERNRHLLCTSLGISDSSRLIIPHQVHGTEVCQITDDFLKMTEEERRQLLEGIDAVMTDQQGICIGVSTADCIPVILYDPVCHCAAAVHAGWRGTVARIVQKAVKAMAEAYSCEPAKLKAVIGPGISCQNFEVGQEVADLFREAGFPVESMLKLLPSTADSDSSPLTPHIDLPLCNRLQLEELGVPASAITDCAICTFDHTDDYFSARKMGILSGRIYTGIVLR